MEPNAENSCRRDAIKEKLRQNFDGKIVRTLLHSRLGDSKFRPEHFTNDYGFITDYLG